MSYREARTADLPEDAQEPAGHNSPKATGPTSGYGRSPLAESPRRTASTCEFHRRRAEIEMDRALAAGQLSIAVRHLELARLHRERRAHFGLPGVNADASAFRAIDRTDKEG